MSKVLSEDTNNIVLNTDLNTDEYCHQITQKMDAMTEKERISFLATFNPDSMGYVGREGLDEEGVG